MTHYQTIKFEKIEAGVFITLNRPDVHNALNEAMIAELTEAISLSAEDPKSRYVMIQGAGKSLCAGADIHWMQQMANYTFQENVADARKLADLFKTIYQAKLPVIVHAKGSVFGGGVGLVAACDIVIAETETVFCLSEVKLGMIPAVISPYIIRAMGERQAKRYALTAERLTATEACQIGLVHQLVTSTQAEAELIKLQKALLLGSPMAQQHTKRLFKAVSNQPITQEVHEMTASAIAEARASLDGKEGLRAFLEKRQPSWGQ
ncbi:enoyl-CoA hydratase/isomerase family protein [Candidatus Paracaedibacter symbiosus]|uniref:enoyl-CoA hydratase/isomerase family protein n=1 Tax=Candidatus Paracaedibacter symbiosus TaxID=244582 RepID=UPI0005096EA5|nr:enoyl-CoA hydratase/isomerase family protein [Candidatus Paracaedibacter symbiosus]